MYYIVYIRRLEIKRKKADGLKTEENGMKNLIITALEEIQYAIMKGTEEGTPLRRKIGFGIEKIIWRVEGRK